MTETQATYGEQDRSVVKYVVNGQDVRLTPNMVIKYLVTGKRELVTEQEIIYFMHICRARSLNPFNKDCYLIKYTNDPAAIVVSIDKLRMQARKSADCEGWKCGVIVQDKSGQLRYSKGLVLEGEKLLGGWFEAKPRGWSEPFQLEVNLRGYIKRNREGAVTQFWQEDRQPTMIAKVAEAQGLRRLWPEQTQGLYTHEEIDARMQDEPIDITPAGATDSEPPPRLNPEAFGKVLEDPALDNFLAVTAEKNHAAVSQVITSANDNPGAFIGAFQAWKLKNLRKEFNKEEKPAETQAPPQEPPHQGHGPEQPEPAPAGIAKVEAEMEKREVDYLHDRIKQLTNLHQPYVLQAKKNLGMVLSVTPQTIDGCHVLIDEVERLLEERPPRNGKK